MTPVKVRVGGHMPRVIWLALLVACTPAPEPETQTLHQSVVSAIDACKADEECFAKLQETEVGNCPWYDAIGCSALTIAAGAACVVTEGEACLEALELVKAAGCCHCLPKGKVQDICNSLP